MSDKNRLPKTPSINNRAQKVISSNEINSIAKEGLYRYEDVN